MGVVQMLAKICHCGAGLIDIIFDFVGNFIKAIFIANILSMRRLFTIAVIQDLPAYVADSDRLHLRLLVRPIHL